MHSDRLTHDDLMILEEALTHEIIKNDRSQLPGDLKRNRARLRLKCRLFAVRLARDTRSASLELEGV